MVEAGHQVASKYFFFLNFSWGHILIDLYLICSVLSLSPGLFDYICTALLLVGIFFNGYIYFNFQAEELERIREKIQKAEEHSQVQEEVKQV